MHISECGLHVDMLLRQPIYTFGIILLFFFLNVTFNLEKISQEENGMYKEK